MRPTTSEAGEPPREAAETRFAEIYADHGQSVMAYALRRASGPEDAADVVAETFLAAWRRAEEIPSGPEARLWLYGISRGLLANQQRGERRRAHLSERLRTERSTRASSEPAPEAETTVMRALERVDPKDREVLLLAGWEGLEPAEIARVLGISRVAVRSRLHRARRRLQRELAEAEPSQASPRMPRIGFEEAR